MTKRNTLFHTMLAAALMLFGAQAQADLILTEGDAAYSGPGFTPFVMDADWLEGIVGSADILIQCPDIRAGTFGTRARYARTFRCRSHRIWSCSPKETIGAQLVTI